MDRRLFLRASLALGSSVPLGGLTASQVSDLLNTVAQESRLAAAGAGGTDIGRGVLDRLHADVREIAGAYLTEPALPLFARMTAVRDEVFARLFDDSGATRRQLRPGQAAELQQIAGRLLCLMSTASLYLGVRPAAADQAQAALSCGEESGDNSICAVARTQQALLAYWSGRYSEAVALTADGRSRTQAGSLLARLWILEGRAQAYLGDTNAALRSLSAAESAFGTQPHELPDQIGGEFAYQLARLKGSTAILHDIVGDHARATQEAAQAVDLWRQTPPTQQSYGAAALTLIDQATAHLRLGEVGGAHDALTPVLALPDSHRIEPYSIGLGTVRGLLGDPRRQGAESAALTERIDAFTAALPPRVNA